MQYACRPSSQGPPLHSGTISRQTTHFRRNYHRLNAARSGTGHKHGGRHLECQHSKGKQTADLTALHSACDNFAENAWFALKLCQSAEEGLVSWGAGTLHVSVQADLQKMLISADSSTSVQVCLHSAVCLPFVCWHRRWRPPCLFCFSVC